jgi:hypothetical protein
VGNLNKQGFNKLIEAMKKLSVDVNDREICKKLETLMLTSKDDLSLPIIKILLTSPLEFDTRDIPEPYGQYVKHFIYMVKRNEKQGLQKYNSVEIEDSSIMKRIVGEKKKLS